MKLFTVNDEEIEVNVKRYVAFIRPGKSIGVVGLYMHNGDILMVKGTLEDFKDAF